MLPRNQREPSECCLLNLLSSDFLYGTNLDDTGC